MEPKVHVNDIPGVVAEPSGSALEPVSRIVAVVSPAAGVLQGNHAGEVV